MATEFVIDRNTWCEAFSQLPRDREVSFAPRSAEQAVDMRRKRVELARHIAESLAQSLLRAIESRDPINGYSAEEWKEINKSPDNEKL